MNIRLVIADYDNTLAPTGEPLPERNREALYELHRRNIPFVLASGKNLYNLKVVEDSWQLDFKQPFVMGMNGAELLDRKREVVHEYELLSGEKIRELCDMMEPFHLNPFVYWKDGMLMERSDAEAEASCRRNKLRIYLTSEYGPIWQRPNAKVIYRVAEEMVPEVRKFVEERKSNDWVLVQTQKTVLEFVRPETSKGHTLQRICEMESIALSDVMAFGDSENDEEMLRICHGICLKDGMESTKQIAEDITDLDCVDGGLGDYLFKHVLL